MDIVALKHYGWSTKVGQRITERCKVVKKNGMRFLKRNKISSARVCIYKNITKTIYHILQINHNRRMFYSTEIIYNWTRTIDLRPNSKTNNYGDKPHSCTIIIIKQIFPNIYRSTIQIRPKNRLYILRKLQNIVFCNSGNRDEKDALCSKSLTQLVQKIRVFKV